MVRALQHRSPASSSQLSFTARVHRLALKPGERVRSLRGNNIAPKVTCSLDIELLAGHAHQRYFIIKPAPNQPFFRSFAYPSGRTGVFTHEDLSPMKRHRQTSIGHGKHKASHNVTYFQTVILHEFGHTLGLDHIHGSGNDSNAYGITLEERSNEMGVGNVVNSKQAQPWISQMRRHLIPNHKDQPVSFKPRVIAPQQVSYFYTG